MLQKKIFAARINQGLYMINSGPRIKCIESAHHCEDGASTTGVRFFQSVFAYQKNTDLLA
jgi:hypothetical protein